MAFEDLFSSLGNIFSGGTQTQDATPAPTGSGIVAKPEEAQANPFAALALGIAPMVLSKLMGRGEQKQIDKAQKQIGQISGVTIPQGRMMVDRASRGELTDPQKAAVEQMKAGQNARWSQYMANLGIPVSSSMVEAHNLVDTQAQELANKLINESFTQGLEALKLGGTSSTQLLQNAMKQREDMAKAIQDMMKQVGMVMNTPGQKTTTPGTTTAAPAVPEELAQPDVYDPTAAISATEGMGY